MRGGSTTPVYMPSRQTPLSITGRVSSWGRVRRGHASGGLHLRHGPAPVAAGAERALRRSNHRPGRLPGGLLCRPRRHPRARLGHHRPLHGPRSGHRVSAPGVREGPRWRRRACGGGGSDRRPGQVRGPRPRPHAPLSRAAPPCSSCWPTPDRRPAGGGIRPTGALERH